MGVPSAAGWKLVRDASSPAELSTGSRCSVGAHGGRAPTSRGAFTLILRSFLPGYVINTGAIRGGGGGGREGEDCVRLFARRWGAAIPKLASSNAELRGGLSRRPSSWRRRSCRPPIPQRRRRRQLHGRQDHLVRGRFWIEYAPILSSGKKMSGFRTTFFFFDFCFALFWGNDHLGRLFFKFFFSWRKWRV